MFVGRVRLLTMPVRTLQKDKNFLRMGTGK